MNKKLVTQKTYDAKADLMAAEFNKYGARIEDIDRAFSVVRKFNPYVLEIGCGNGRDAKEILLRTDKYIGIDSSASMLGIARKTAPQGQFILIDVEDFEFMFAPNVDIIFAFASLMHTNKEDLKTIFKRAYEKMNVGAIFYLSLKFGAYKEVIQEDEYGQRIFYLYTPVEIKEVAGEKFQAIYENIYKTRNNEWFTIILKKL